MEKVKRVIRSRAVYCLKKKASKNLVVRDGEYWFLTHKDRNVEKSWSPCCLLVIQVECFSFPSWEEFCLLTTTCFHRCQVISTWAAESQAVLTFSVQSFSLRFVHWRRCDILSFTVKFTEGAENDGSCTWCYWVLSLRLCFVNAVVKVWLKIHMANKQRKKKHNRFGLFTQSSCMGVQFLHTYPTRRCMRAVLLNFVQRMCDLTAHRAATSIRSHCASFLQNWTCFDSVRKDESLPSLRRKKNPQGLF